MTASPSEHPLKAAVLILLALLTLLAASSAAMAGGVTAYLPMNLEPEIERQIERVLILADEPILKRPFSVELVKLALPQACQVDKPLCTRVGKYLERYSRDYAVSHASATGSVAHAKDGVVLPNQHGMPADSDYELSVVAYAQHPQAPWRAWAPTGRNSTSAIAIIGSRP